CAGACLRHHPMTSWRRRSYIHNHPARCTRLAQRSKAPAATSRQLSSRAKREAVRMHVAASNVTTSTRWPSRIGPHWLRHAHASRARRRRQIKLRLAVECLRTSRVTEVEGYAADAPCGSRGSFSHGHATYRIHRAFLGLPCRERTRVQDGANRRDPAALQ